MSESVIAFDFPDRRSALSAFDTLEELGYSPVYQHEKAGERPNVHIHLSRNDLVSALEIAQAYGGTLLEQQSGAVSESAVFSSAYSTDAVLIPAHIVNEDWSEDYAAGSAEGAGHPLTGLSGVDPSPEAYDHFDAGIRL